MGVDIPQGDSIEDKAQRVEQNKDYVIEYLEGLDVGAHEWHALASWLGASVPVYSVFERHDTIGVNTYSMAGLEERF